ncbi:hypothetical protein BH10CHL1_BH10CHL1_28380 [soil metagenome]
MKLWSLRTRLALSHLLPILLLTPLLSLYLLYSLEEFFNQKLLQQLVQQSQLLFDPVQDDPALVESPLIAQRFLLSLAHKTDARIILLSKTGVILGSTRPEDTSRIGSVYEDAAVQRALQGEQVQGIGPGLTTEVVYVVSPVQQAGVTVGALRLSYEVDDIRRQFGQVRRFVLGGGALTGILGLGLAIGLATTITRPLHELSERVQDIATGNYQARVVIHRQDEVGMLAQNFNQMAAHLEEGEKARKRQLAAVVHELARPLTGMRAAVETLVDGAAEDAEIRHTLLSGIAGELARLERLIKTLQDVQRRELRPLRLHYTQVDLTRLIRASMANFEHVAGQLGITLVAQLQPDLPLVQADEDRIIQVLTNLLDNALKFTAHGGTITVKAFTQDSMLEVVVMDTGIGLAPDELPHLFLQFYRGAESRPPEKQGMGLGLAICGEIIAAHGGRIWAESASDRGARFTFTLPPNSDPPVGC